MSLSQPSYYVTAWNKILSKKPILLYTEPPEINDVPEHKRQSVALFCLEAAQHQLRRKKHFVLVHPVDSTLWTIPRLQYCGAIHWFLGDAWLSAPR